MPPNLACQSHFPGVRTDVHGDQSFRVHSHANEFVYLSFGGKRKFFFIDLSSQFALDRHQRASSFFILPLNCRPRFIHFLHLSALSRKAAYLFAIPLDKRIMNKRFQYTHECISVGSQKPHGDFPSFTKHSIVSSDTHCINQIVCQTERNPLGFLEALALQISLSQEI